MARRTVHFSETEFWAVKVAISRAALVTMGWRGKKLETGESAKTERSLLRTWERLYKSLDLSKPQPAGCCSEAKGAEVTEPLTPLTEQEIAAIERLFTLAHQPDGAALLYPHELSALRRCLALAQETGKPPMVEFLNGVAPQPLHQRASDLLRYCRRYLSDEKLITADEFTALLVGVDAKDGSQSARRLEDYDVLLAERDELKTALHYTVNDRDALAQRLGAVETAATHLFENLDRVAMYGPADVVREAARKLLAALTPPRTEPK
jgi:hypothetical protein